jgi:hypothetical protein
MEAIEYWRFCDELTIIQAALLIAGEDPGPTQDYVEGWSAEKRPVGYEAAKTALSNALKQKAIEGQISWLPERDYNGEIVGKIEGATDVSTSLVSVESLCDFLAKRGYKEGFFARSKEPSPDYLDPENPCYAPKLAAAVRAWKAISTDPALLAGKTPKKAIEKWLRENASYYGLSDEDGNPNKDGIEQISKVTNWRPEGGATKTPGNLPTPKKRQE